MGPCLLGVGDPDPPPLHCSHLDFLIVPPPPGGPGVWVDIGEAWGGRLVLSPAFGLHTEPFLGALIEPDKD